MIRGTRKISKLNEKTLKSLIKQMKKFCRDTMGGKHKIKVKFIHDDTLSYYGEYDFNTHTLKICSNVCVTLDDMVKTFIHEYRHSTQPCKRNYHRLLDEHGYTKHPYEIEAELAEELYYKPLMKILVIK